MKCQSLFSGENKKNIKLSSAEMFVQHVTVKCLIWYRYYMIVDDDELRFNDASFAS